MLFQTFIILLLPVFAVADFDVYHWSCSDGFGGLDLITFTTDEQAANDVCSTGCSADDQEDPTNPNLSGGNPCNPDCNADPLDLIDDGNDGLSIIVQNTGIQVGTCYSENAPEKQRSCNVGVYGCAVFAQYRCITGYCN